MPTPTYAPLAKSVLATNQTSVTISGISSSYTDLLLVISSRNDSSTNSYDNIRIEINSATTGYSERILYTTLNTPTSFSNSQAFFALFYQPNANSTANTFGSVEIYFPNYAGSTNKEVLSTSVTEKNGTTIGDVFISAGAHLWSNTAAINQLKFTPGSGTNFIAGSRFDLYGIKNS
jgi:hypothetical protein